MMTPFFAATKDSAGDSVFKAILKNCLPLVDLLLSPFTLISVLVLKFIRRGGSRHMKISHRIFRRVGVYPIRDHYYEPLFSSQHLRHPKGQDRDLPGLDMNDREQLALLDQFHFNEELEAIPVTKGRQLEFYYHNGSFESGDAEYWFNVIRLFKPHRIIEVGSGNSTLIAHAAVAQNKAEDPQYSCDHVCIEPYEMPWLEQLPAVRIIRNKVEDTPLEVFQNLERNDILFIDSSHVLRAQGDVEYEVLRILPRLNPGVVVHFHDIFTPKDYMLDWDREEQTLFFNEQYILEAFLCSNRRFRIIGAVNYLRHHYPEHISQKCPMLAREIDSREPGSFWIVRH